MEGIGSGGIAGRIFEIIGNTSGESRVDVAIEVALTPIVATFGKANVMRVLKGMKAKKPSQGLQ